MLKPDINDEDINRETQKREREIYIKYYFFSNKLCINIYIDREEN